MDFMDLIDALEDLVENGRRVPGTGKKMVERDEMAGLLDKLRANVPAELEEADEIRSRGESIVNEAFAFAKKMKVKSEQERRTRVDQSSIVEEAEAMATQIRAGAESDAERVKQRTDSDAARRIKESDTYAGQSLGRLATHVAEIGEEIQNLQNELASLERSIENGTRYLQARWATDGNGHANGNGHSNGNGSGHSNLQEEDLVTVASNRGPRARGRLPMDDDQA